MTRTVAAASAILTLLLGCGNEPLPVAAADGYEVELVAGPPLVERPMIVDMDELGRLYVAESSGSNDAVQQQLIDRPHSILRLEDSNQDGVYDKRTVFADKMMLPEGVLWFDGSLYVAAPPVIWKLTDTDGDGVADKREEWLDAKTLTNCANDLHGPYLGLDGWIYWAKGAFAEQTYERAAGDPFVTRAAHIFRRRPEGGEVEPVLTGGMDNPVEVAFTPEGERLLTSTFLEQPKLGRRDGLIHAVYGGVYGKVHGVYDDHPQTGKLLDAMTHMGPAAPVGLALTSSGDLLATSFNLHKVTRHKLIPEGATFRTEDADLLTSESVDFHPTDVMEDADGSLLVVDTGPWYKICCPTSQLSKPDLPGAIYRLRKQGATPPDDPLGLDVDWSGDLIALLDDARPFVRKRAVHESAKRGDVGPLAAALEGGTADRRRNAVWALTRIEKPEAREAVRRALSDSEATVRHAAIHSAAVRRDVAAVPLLLDRLRQDGPALKRAAAEALGRAGSSVAVAALLDEAGAAGDPVLWHSLTYALIEIGDAAATRQGLRSAASGTRRAALVALDQMRGGGVPPDAVVPLLSSDDDALRESAEWVAVRHRDWGPQLESFFRRRLAAPGDDASRERLETQLAAFAGDPTIQSLIGSTVAGRGAAEGRKTALRVMTRSAGAAPPAGWSSALLAALGASDQDVVQEALAAARALQLRERDAALDAALGGMGSREGLAPRLRAEALAAAAGGVAEIDARSFEFLVAQLGSDAPVAIRSAAASALADAPLSSDQRLELADAFSQAGPVEAPTLLNAFAAGGGDDLGERLVAGLSASSGKGNLLPGDLETLFAKFPPATQQRGAALLETLHEGRSRQLEKLDELTAQLEGGDVRRGQAVFNSSKAACRSCHRIGYLGGRVGPDLTKIGEIRSERDLLEAVVYPSASFVRSFEPVVVVTQADIYNGVPLEETDESLLLATGAESEVRIARADIEEVRPGAVSVMPSGLEEELTRQELADLIAYLRATRWGPQ